MKRTVRIGRDLPPICFLALGLLCTSHQACVADPIEELTHGQIRKLTNIENAYPDWSPDGSKLAFQSNRTGKFQIYVMNADGTNVVRLTNNAGVDVGPHFSPDGSKIVFSSERDGSPEIYVMNADGSKQTRLTKLNVDTSHPSWSPDGTRIIFCSNKDTPDRGLDWWDQYHDIYTMRADGSDIRRVTDFHTVCTFPVYSPDGSKIAFRKVIKTPGFYDDPSLTLSGTNSEVFVMNADGTNEQNLSKSAAYDGWPAWSPDGKKIVFGSNRAMVTQLYIVNVDGSHLARLLNDRETDEDTRPAWSHDGKKIAFTRMRNGTMDIYVVDVSGKP
jgi:TolB protein